MAGGTRALNSAALLAAGALGAAFSLGGAALFGGFGHSTTTVREVQATPAATEVPVNRTRLLSVNDIYRRDAPGVVQITATQIVNGQSSDLFGFPFPTQQQQQSLGSGFVIDKAGHIVTNYHVVEGAKTVDVSFSNNESMKAKVVGADPSTDIAVLQVDAHARALTPLTLGNSDAVRVGDSVVAIGNPFGLPTPSTQQAEALGSGFVIDKAGHIVTNYHVVEGAKSVDVSFSNNESKKAKVVGVDPSTDIAVLQVDAHARALTPLPLGNSDSVHVGDSVVAIGNPFGYDRTVTTGIVSALQRVIQAPNSYSIDHVIQTDAALNKGNSGGPLLDARGEVIGVNSQISTGGSGTSGNVGIGFAVPINTVRTVAAQLISSGHVNHAYIGITAQPVSKSAARLFHLPVSHGLLVAGVQSGSGAAKAGLRAAKQSATLAGETYPLGGDLIASVDGTPLYSIDQLRDAIANKQPGDDVKLGVYRGSDKRTVTVTLGRQPTTG